MPGGNDNQPYTTQGGLGHRGRIRRRDVSNRESTNWTRRYEDMGVYNAREFQAYKEVLQHLVGELLSDEDVAAIIMALSQSSWA